MSYLIDKSDLKANRFYRKVKLDIDEIMDSSEAQEDLGLDKDIFGDDEGYFLVSNKLEDGYRVRFITLSDLIIHKVLKTQFNRGKDTMEINEFGYELDNIKKIAKRDLDLDEMDDKYVKLDISNIITELITQYKTGGKKGIGLSKAYTEDKVKTTKLKKSKEEVKPKKEVKPKEEVKPISEEELQKKSIINNSAAFKNLYFLITNGSARNIAEYLTADDYNGSTKYSSALKAFKDYFKVGDLSERTGDKWNKILENIVLEKYSKEKMEDLVYQMIKNEIETLEKEKQKLIKENLSVVYENGLLLDHILFLKRLGKEVYNDTDRTEKKLLETIIKQILSPTKAQLEQIEKLKNNLELYKEKDTAFHEVYNRGSNLFDSKEYLKGEELVAAELRLLNAVFALIKAGLIDPDIKSNKDILEYFANNPYSADKGNKYGDFTKFEKFAIEKGLKEKKKKKQLNIKPFKKELKESDLTDSEKKKLFEEFDFKFTPELKGLLT